MELIKNFGINPYLLGAQIINFLIVLYILKRFAYKPIMEMLEKRKKTIADGLKSAQESQEALQKALNEEKKILHKAQIQAKQILLDANIQSDALIQKAKDSGKEQVFKMLAEAKIQTEKDRKEMEKQLATKTTELAVAILEKTLKGLFDPSDQQKVIEKAVKNLKK